MEGFEDVEKDALATWPLKRCEPLALERILTSYVVEKNGYKLAKQSGPWEQALRTMGDMRSIVEEAPARHQDEEGLLRAHYCYAASLTHAIAHFPLYDGSTGCVWEWSDATTGHACKSVSVDFEIGAVLYNAAVLLMGLAGQQVQDKEGLVEAMRHYAVVAGLFEEVRRCMSGQADLTHDVSPAMLETMVRWALCHMQHVQYLLKVWETPDFATPLACANLLADEAQDVAMTYADLRTRLTGPVPKAILNEAGTWQHVFEVRAQLHAARALHLSKEYGEEIFRLKKAHACLELAQSTAQQLSRQPWHTAVTRAAGLLATAREKAEQQNFLAKQVVKGDLSKLPPLKGTGRPPLTAVPCNDCFMQECPKDPFYGLPLAGYVRPRPLVPPVGAHGLPPRPRTASHPTSGMAPSPIIRVQAAAGDHSPTSGPHGHQHEGSKHLASRLRASFSTPTSTHAPGQGPHSTSSSEEPHKATASSSREHGAVSPIPNPASEGPRRSLGTRIRASFSGPSLDAPPSDAPHKSLGHRIRTSFSRPADSS